MSARYNVLVLLTRSLTDADAHAQHLDTDPAMMQAMKTAQFLIPLGTGAYN